MKSLNFATQPQIDAIPIPSVRAYADQPDINAHVLLWELVTTATDGVGGAGGGVPDGGLAGQLIVKQSVTNGDAAWESLVLSGGGP